MRAIGKDLVMKHYLNGYRIAAGAALVAAIGCGSRAMPRELVDARSAYAKAAAGDAPALTPAAMHDAHTALANAEQSYKKGDDDVVMRGKAYVALRKAEMATVLASAERSRLNETQANIAARAQKDRAEYATQKRLEETQQALAQSNAALANEAARADTERQARMALEKVAKAEALKIKDEPRGTVVTVKVPFESGKSDLPPQATQQLAPLADALKLTKNREIVVEGHTDNRGSEAANLDLSQRRADTVREYLVTHEVPSNKVSATGVGEAEPPDTNATPKGRANNRVVQIVVKQPGVPAGDNGEGR